MKSLIFAFLAFASLAMAETPQIVSGKQFTLDEVAKQKFELAGKIVRLNLVSTIFDAEQVSPTEYKIFVKNGSGTEYNYIYFPKEGADKLGLLKKKSGSMNFYVLVQPDKLTAVGRSLSISSGGTPTLVW